MSMRAVRFLGLKQQLMRRDARLVLAAAAIVVVVGALVARLAPSLQPPAPPVSPPFCGRSVNIGPAYDARPTECLWQAYSTGKPAKAIVVQYTIEGDPVTFAVDLASGEQIDVGIDSKDRYGPNGSFSYSCNGLSREPVLTLQGRFHLIVTGCTGPPGYLFESRLIIP
jgi:hypothetical protein